jgi:S1-C subfamily serine protease
MQQQEPASGSQRDAHEAREPVASYGYSGGYSGAPTGHDRAPVPYVYDSAHGQPAPPVPQASRAWPPSPAPTYNWLPAGGRKVAMELRWPAVLGIVLLLLALVVGGSMIANAAINNSNSRSAAGIGAQAAPTVAVPPSATDLQQTVINVIKTVQPSVVEITSKAGRGSAIGSGEIITTDGYIVTNDHVVRGFTNFTVTLANGQSYPATLRGEAPDDDLAVLKINASGLRPIAIGDSSQVQVGQFAIAIGSPLGLEQSATFGIISALDRTESEGPDGPAATLTGLIQTSAPINPGNSGGALVDLQGRLIGIPTLGASTQNGAADGIGFAIPSNRAKDVAQQLIEKGSVTSTGRGFMGIGGQDVTPELAQAYNLPVQSGVIITRFAADASGKSPAQQAGLRVSDIIVSIDGRSIPNQSTLQSVLSGKVPGAQVKVGIWRGQQQTTITVTLGERPTSQG